MSDWSLIVFISSSIEQCQSVELLPLTTNDEYTVHCHCEENRYLCLNVLEMREMVHRCYSLLFSSDDKDDNQLNVLTRVLLCYVSECLTSWNIRRRLVRSGTIEIESELTFVETLLQLRPKSEQIFRYRRWLRPSSILRELQICDLTAERHPMNYASWQHRRWLMDQFSVNVDEELQRNLRWLERNLSDSSGFSFRAFLIARRPNLIDEEFNLNERMLRVFVDRESLWIYRQTLVFLSWQVFPHNKDELFQRESHQFFSERYRRSLERNK